jgi:hypothetical protein
MDPGNAIFDEPLRLMHLQRYDEALELLQTPILNASPNWNALYFDGALGDRRTPLAAERQDVRRRRQVKRRINCSSIAVCDVASSGGERPARAEHLKPGVYAGRARAIGVARIGAI